LFGLENYFLALADKNEIARVAKSVMVRLFKEKYALIEDMQRDDDVKTASVV
jgi:hypothetical protein